MFVGKYLQLRGYRSFVDFQYLGAAIGDLGRHTQITPDGMPVFDIRVEVLFKVSADVPKLLTVHVTNLNNSQIIYISQLTQTATFGLTKVAVILFYRRC